MWNRINVFIIILSFFVIGAVTIEDTETNYIRGNNNTVNVTGVNITGTNKYLLVGVGFNNNQLQNVSSVSIDLGGGDETNLTQIANTLAAIQDDGLTDLWGVVNPPDGNFTVTVIIDTDDVSTGENLGAGVWVLNGVNQTVPTGNTDSFTNTSAMPTITVGIDANDTAFGCSFMEDESSQMNITTGVESWEQTDLDGFGGGYNNTSAGNMTVAWTTSGNDKTCASGVEINAAIAAPAGRRKITLSN